MKLATTVKPFFDLKEGVSRNVGDTFSCEDERGGYLKSLELVTLEDAPAQKKKKSVKKKEV